MKENRWQKIEGIFNRAVALPPAERRQYVETACAEDAELGREILHLLETDDAPENFLDAPVAALAAQFLDTDEPPDET